MFSKTLLTVATITLMAPAAGYAAEAGMPELPDRLKVLDRPVFEDGPFIDRDTMALSYVSSIGVDSFRWYRNDSIGGDTFEIDSMTTNVAAPFQIAVEINGSWDFEVHSATSIYVYTAGAGTMAVSAGTLTLGDGYHLIYNDTAAGGSELVLDMPGPPAPSGSGSGSGSGGGGFGSGCGFGSGGGGFGSGGPPNPLWDEIEAEFAHVEWKGIDGRQQYRFLGNNEASNLYADLHQPRGTGDIDVSWIGDTNCSSLSMPAELTDDAVSVSSGHHYFEAGTSGDGPWTLSVSIGRKTCDEDLNGDGRVNIHDLVILMAAFGTCP